MTEQLKRDRAEAPRRRLVALKQYGLNQVPWGVPDSWRAKVATALEGYVTLENFPSWVSDQQAYAFVRGKVEELLQPYRDEVAREQQEAARGEQQAQDKRWVQTLIDDGARYASGKTLSDWESDDRARALRDVEQLLKDKVEPGWTEQRVQDAVDDELAKWEEEPDDDDKDVENDEETDEF